MSSRTPGRAPEHTMLIKAPTFSKSGRAWRPFRFSGLEKVSKRHGHLVRNLEWMLPSVRATGEVSTSVRNRLQQMLEEAVSLQAEFVHVVPGSSLGQYVGSPTFLAVLAPQPHKTRGLLEVELSLAHQAIDLLLGGAGEAVALRPLSDIEEGVMTYVIIETLKALSPALDPALPRLRIEAVVRGLEDVQGLIDENEQLVVVQLKAVFGAQAGYVRLFIPEGVLASASPAPDAAVRRARRAADAEAHAARLRNVKTELRAEIGTVEISGGDLAQLRERDVVLVDGLSCRPDQPDGGTARLRCGPGRAGHLAASVAVHDGRYQATVTGVVLGAPAPADTPTGEAAAPAPEDDDEATMSAGMRGSNDVDDAQGATGADLMNDIPLQIAVELGRVATTAEELVAVKVGHVFDLNRLAGDPLDLSVNGKIIARGELVEIDGNLGVRIVSLAG